jgi:flagellar biosynthesis protein FliR
VVGALQEIVALLEDGRVGPAILGTGLASARLFAMARTLPFLGGRRVPATLHLGLAVVLALVMGRGLDVPCAAPAIAVLALKEVLVGFAVGLLASLPFHFLEQAGMIMDLARTTSLSGQGVGGSSRTSSPTGNLLLFLAMAVFFLTPAHRAFWMGVRATFDAVPIAPAAGAADAIGGMALEAISASSGLFAASVMIAFPVLLAVLLADLAIGAAGRFVPHSGGTFAFMPLRSVVGLAALLASLAAIAPVVARLLLR